MRRRCALWLCLTFGLLIAAGSILGAGPPYFTLKEIRVGQKGLGYTVLYGTEVKSFNVDVLGIVQSSSKDRSLILIKVSGSALKEVQGIAAGMSGSPVFIGNRLAGAISYAFNRADPSIGLVTPIEDMLQLWERDYRQTAMTLAPSPILPPGLRTAVPVTTPLLLSGRRIPRELEQAVTGIGLQPVAAAESLGPWSEIAPPLEPGSAIGAAFAMGDYTAVSIGTVTWIDGKRFLAFGHPVTNAGGVDYLATGVYIHRILNSIDLPFKVGVPMNQVGRFTQDRGAGASGVLGGSTDPVRIRATITDKNTGRKAVFNTAVVRQDSLFRAMVLAAFLDAMDRTLDQYSPGTARVSLQVEADGLETPLIRRNFFYDAKDMAPAALAEVGKAIDLLSGNEFQAARIRTIQFEAVLDPAPLVASVVAARADRTKVHPGDRVTIEVEVRPFRAAAFKVPFYVTIPAKIALGKLVISIRGGYATDQENGDNAEDLAGLLADKHASSLVQLVSEFVNQPRNNDLILEYLPLSGEAEAGNGSGEQVPPILLIQGCDYVIKGQTQLVLEVEAPASPQIDPPMGGNVR